MSLDICDEQYQVDVTLAAGRMWVGPRTTPETLAAWIEALRAEPEREVPTDTGTIRASVLIERYVDADALTHITPEAAMAAVRGYGWGV